MEQVTLANGQVVDVGCWIDGALRGWRSGQRLIQIAQVHGFTVSDVDEEAADAYYQADYADDEELAVNAEVADDLVRSAEDHMNTLAPEGFMFGWSEGDRKSVV